MATGEIDEWVFQQGDWIFTISSVVTVPGLNSLYSLDIKHTTHEKQYIRYMEVKGKSEAACFVCATRMPSETYLYFKRCQEMIQCVI